MNHEKQPPSPSKPTFFILSGLLILCFIAGGYGLYRHETSAVQTEAHDKIKAVADLKIRQIVSWRQEREADARIHSTGLIRTYALAWLKAPGAVPAIKTELKNRLQTLREYQGYDNVILAGIDGRLLLTLDPRLTNLEPDTQRLVARAVSSHNVVFGDFFRCPDCNRIHLDIAAPVPGEDNLPAAVLILRTDPAQYLYPLIQTWPLPSKTAETLIVRRDGDDVVFLNTLRFRPNTPLSIRIPISKADVPAVQAALGQTGLFRGHDYRDVDVLADIRPVPGSLWFMVAKADTDEILAEVRYRGVAIGFLTLMLTLLAGTSAGYLYKHQGKRAFQALYRVERDLRNAEKEFKTTLYSIGDAVITTDVDGRIRQMNPVAEHLTGWTETDAKGRSADEVFRIIAESTGETVDSPVQKVLEKGLIVGLANHTLLIAKDGTQIPIADSGAPIRDESGDITGVVLVFRDQSKERSAAAMLRQSEKKYRIILEDIEDGYYEVDLNGSFTFFNDSMCRILGYPREELMGMNDLQYTDKKNAKKLFKTFNKVYRTGEPSKGFDWQTTRKDGTKRYIEGSVALQKNLSGIPIGFQGLSRDITERKRAEAELHALSTHQQALLSAIPDIIIEVDIDKVYTWANQSGYDFFGEDVIGKEAGFYFEGEQFVYDTVQPLFNGSEDTIYLESWQRRKDGQKRLLAWWCRVLKDQQGNAAGALSTARDITDLKALEGQLLQAQKMESVGRLAGGVAHDFNNMLMVIIGYTEMVMGQVDPELPIFNDLQEILGAAKRSAALTRQLLAFARKQIISPVVLDINETIASMLKLLRQLIGEDIDLAWKPGLDTWPVKMDPAQIDQMLANLLVNAKDAIGGVGSVTIETGNVEFDEIYCAGNAGFVPGKYVMLAVSDTGGGMDKHILEHVFEPFFTTKELGKGTGLGLATLYGIVKQNNGFINVYSEPGQGTTFKIYLPRTETGLAEETVAASGKNLLGTETVLLVEDEESILTLGTSILTQYGYTVLSTKNPFEALVLAKHHDGPIHLLVTDVVMPKMNGKKLQKQLCVIRPETKCLFMSGYTANAIAHHGVLDEGVHFLQKPFSVMDMAEKVREVLDEE